MRTAKILIRLGDAQADLNLCLTHLPFCWFCWGSSNDSSMPIIYLTAKPRYGISLYFHESFILQFCNCRLMHDDFLHMPIFPRNLICEQSKQSLVKCGELAVMRTLLNVCCSTARDQICHPPAPKGKLYLWVKSGWWCFIFWLTELN